MINEYSLKESGDLILAPSFSLIFDRMQTVIKEQFEHVFDSNKFTPMLHWEGDDFCFIVIEDEIYAIGKALCSRTDERTEPVVILIKIGCSFKFDPHLVFKANKISDVMNGRRCYLICKNILAENGGSDVFEPQSLEFTRFSDQVNSCKISYKNMSKFNGSEIIRAVQNSNIPIHYFL